MQPIPDVKGKILRAGAVIGSLVLLLIVGNFVYNLLVFRISGTNPSLSSVSTYTSTVQVNFNHTLRKSSVKISDFGGILSGSIVSNKTLSLKIGQSLKVGQTYTIIIDRAEDTGGKVIINKPITFVVKDIPYDELSKEEQQSLIQNQDVYPYSVSYVTYKNFDALTSQGVSTGQLQNIKEAVYAYSQSINKEFWTVNLQPSTLRVVFNDPTAKKSLTSSATFTIAALGKDYIVRAEYSGLDNKTYTRIYTADGAQVYSNQ